MDGTEDLKRWATVAGVAFDLSESMADRSDAELTDARKTLTRQWAAGIAQEQIGRVAMSTEGEVILSPDDMSSLAEYMPSARELAVPLLLNGASYYLSPDPKSGAGAAKAYALLAGAMQRSGRVAVSSMALRGRHHPVVLGVGPDGTLVAQQLYWPGEVREAPAAPEVGVTDQEEALADQLVRALSAEELELQEVDEYSAGLALLVDTVRERQLAIANGQSPKLALPATEPKTSGAPDLTALLASSLASARGSEILGKGQG